MLKTPRSLGFVDVFCLGLNAIIGSGIFFFPGKLAALAGPASIAAFLLCGLLLTAVALCYAELAAMTDGSGGSYLYAREAFGEEIGFGVGLVAWATAVLSWAAVASMLAAQCGYFHAGLEGDAVRRALAAAGVAAFGALNYRGVKPGAWTVDLLTAAKLLPLAFFVLIGLPAVDFSRFSPFFAPDPAASAGFYAGGRPFGYAVFLALWALQGFEVAPVPAGETSNPQRDIPRAVVGSLLAATAFYCLIQAVAVGAFPGLGASLERPLVDAALHFGGRRAAAFVALGGVVSMLGFVAGAALGSPRYLSALGERSLRAFGLGAVHPRYATPSRAIAATTACAAACVLLLDFDRLVDLSNLAVVSQYLASCLALIALRARRPEAARPFRAPAGLWTAAAGCAVSLWLMTKVGRLEAAGAAGLLIAGYLLRYCLDRKDR